MRRCVLAFLLQLGLLNILLTAASPEKFSIMAWNSTNGSSGFPRLESKSLFAGMKECGFTCAGFVAPSQLDDVWAAGLYAYVMDPRCYQYNWNEFDAETARKNFRELAAETKDHPAVIGYYLRDEPSTANFKGLAEMSAIVREFAPGKIPYINLFPNYVDKEAIQCSYREHVERFIESCKPSYLSYDFYGIFTDKHPEVKKNPSYVRPGMWENLALFRELSQKHRIPFWVINLTTSHWGFRVPTPADLSFQAYSALAYGARGLGHFTYITPALSDFYIGPVAVDGAKNPVWYDVAALNKQLLALGPLIEQLESTAVYHFPVDQPGQEKPTAKSLIAKISGGRFVVGDFTAPADGGRYAMIVNCDLVNPVTPAITFRGDREKVKMVSLGNPSERQPYQRGAKLGPGGAMLLKMEN